MKGLTPIRRRAFQSRFLTTQTIGRSKPICNRQLAQAALERPRPPRTSGNSFRTVSRLPVGMMGRTAQLVYARGVARGQGEPLGLYCRMRCGLTRYDLTAAISAVVPPLMKVGAVARISKSTPRATLGPGSIAGCWATGTTAVVGRKRRNFVRTMALGFSGKNTSGRLIVMVDGPEQGLDANAIEELAKELFLG